MNTFTGFPAGRLPVTPLPDLFFSELLGQIDHLAELKLTLHVCWRLAHHKSPLCLSRSELAADPVLRQSIDMATLDDALQRAVARQTLLVLRARNRASEVEHWYFLNNETGRRDAEQVRQGQSKLRREPLAAEASAPSERPNIFALYEQHIGLLTPMLAEQLTDAAQTYPPDWIAEAFETAKLNNKRNWRYIHAVLQGWTRDGRGTPSATIPERPTRRPPALKPKR